MKVTVLWDIALFSLVVMTLYPWWQYAPLKHWSIPTGQHGAVFQKAAIFMSRFYWWCIQAVDL